ncbi:MAG: site-2 protease family protein [candidate division WOR-3 bacterium]
MEVESIATYGPRIIVLGKIREPRRENIEKIKDELRPFDYLPIFQIKEKKEMVECFPYFLREEKPKILLNLILFIATIVSTLLVGSYHQIGSFPKRPVDLVAGIPFSFSLMAILTFHEFGHYFTAQRNRVKTTLPFFLPIPHPLIGTFGAIMRIKTLIPNRQALARLGMAGPLAGFIIALPLTVIGLFFSKVKFTGEGVAGIHLGESILFALLANIIHPNIPKGYDLFLHPMAYAGWLGFLVTSMNLMPIGQLDGGHIAYALIGRRRLYIIPVIILLLILLCQGWIYGWFFWLGIALLLSRRDPVIQDTITPLSFKDRLISLIPYIILILTFTPVPFIVK